MTEAEELNWDELFVDSDVNTYIDYWIRQRCWASIKKLGLDSDQEYQDIKQEVWAALWQYRNNIKEGLTMQVLGITIRNVCLRLQKNKYNPMLETEALDPKTPLSDTSGEYLDAKRALERFEANLGTEDAALFDARVHEGTPYNQIAQNVGLSVWALKMRMVRMKQKLKKELDYDIEI